MLCGCGCVFVQPVLATTWLEYYPKDSISPLGGTVMSTNFHGKPLSVHACPCEDGVVCIFHQKIICVRSQYDTVLPDVYPGLSSCLRHCWV